MEQWRDNFNVQWHREGTFFGIETFEDRATLFDRSRNEPSKFFNVRKQGSVIYYFDSESN